MWPLQDKEGNPNKELKDILRQRQQQTQQAIQDWVVQRNKGNVKKVDTYKGFHTPYNGLWWAAVHTGIPFNFMFQGVPQGGGVVDQIVCQHPLAIAEGLKCAQYKSASPSSAFLP